MDENNNNGRNDLDIGKVIKFFWRLIPLPVRFIIVIVTLIFFLVAAFMTSMITLDPVKHLFFNDDVSNSSYQMDAAYETYVNSPCVEGNERCSDLQKDNYSKLKEDEQRFIKKLDKVAARYNLDYKQKYILLTTIFYGNDENYFYDNSNNSSNFTLTSGGFVLDGDDDDLEETETLVKNAKGYLETDTLKELGKQFNVYPVVCKYKTTNANGEKVEVSDPLKYNDVQFTFGFWEKILKTTSEEGFSAAKDECKSREDGKIDTVSAADDREAVNEKYYQYLQENEYFDSKEVLQKTFFEPYRKSHNLKELSEEDKKIVRANITDSIKEIVNTKIALDQMFNLNNACSTLAGGGDNSGYWWPLAGSESNGFAASDSTSTSGSGYGWRIHPIHGDRRFHAGLDIPTAKDSLVIASKSGTVTIAKGGCTEGNTGCNNGAGNYIAIEHPDGSLTRYLHLNSFRVNAGQSVQQGQVIALSGNTGGSTGPHLHFEIRINDNPVNPADYISSSNQRPGATSFSASSSGGTVNPTMAVNNFKENKITFLSTSPLKVTTLAHDIYNSTSEESSTTINSNNNVTGVNISDIKTSAEKRANTDPISGDELANYTGTTDIWTNISQKILDAAGVDSSGNKIDGKGVTFSRAGRCQQYVRLVYEAAGFNRGDSGFASAIDAAKGTLVSKSMSAIPVGAAVYGASNSIYGHVGIYVGNGKVIHNVGSIKVTDLKQWATSFKWIGWGWQAGESDITTASSTAGVSLSTLGNTVCDTSTVGNVQGSGPEQTVCLSLKNAGFSVNAISAIMGNIEAESSWDPANINNDSETKATGLIQWTGDRKNELLSRYPETWQDPANQAAYLLYELNNTYRSTLEYLQTHQDDDVNKMTEEFCNLFERPGEEHCAARKEYGSKYVSYVQNNCGSSSTNGHTTTSSNGITYIDGVMIVNKTYPLPSNYVPENTHEPAPATGKCENCINNDAWSAYQNLKEAGKAAGVPDDELDIVSGYRSYAYQESLYNGYVRQKGKEQADRASARAGYSEHQTGLAMDLGDASSSYNNTKGAKFIHDNAYKYGFILRYPNGKETQTGYKYESWHIRYVGVDLATRLYNNGNWITLEEYFNITSRYSN